jgi:hypothetical protein
MNLPEPVTLTRINGESVTIDALSLIFHDYHERRLVRAILGPHCRDLILWQDDEYDAVGDWTQSQAESRIIDLLGDDIQGALQALVCN